MDLLIDHGVAGCVHRSVLQVQKNVSRKGKEKVGEPVVPPDSFDGNSSGSDMSLDEEFGIPTMRTPGVKKAMEAMHSKLRRFECTRNPVDRLTYDGYVARHYAFMAKVVHDVEPTCFDEAIGNMNWEKAMYEEMDALYENETWDI